MMMKIILHILIILSTLIGAVTTVSAAEMSNEEAIEVMKKLELRLRSDTNEARYLMRVVTPDWTREMRLDSWDDRKGKSFFIHILEPKKDKDTTYLKSGTNLWMYLPKLERDIRIPPSMMLSSWMGSDFTNDDLVKSSSVVEDYTHKILSHENGVVEVESLPKEDAAVVWGKLIHRVRDDGMPLSEDFYDEHGKMVRRMKFEDPKKMGGRMIPTRWKIIPEDKPGHYTEMVIERIRFDVSIPPGTFERANLRKVR